MDAYNQLPTMDVTGTVDVSNPQAVCEAVNAILSARYPDFDAALISRLYRDFAALYSGNFPGFYACDTAYHDMQHVLDVSLATARLIDGYEAAQVSVRIDADLAVTAIIVALFHDAGYIRTRGVGVVSHGAQYTKTHVTRSARFMAHYLPMIGLRDRVPLAGKLVHFTGYEIRPEDIELDNKAQRQVGYLVGTADVVAQMADAGYLEKCRDRLYPEFVVGGIARQRQSDGSVNVVYSSAEDLLLKTPAFIRATLEGRLTEQFGGLYHLLANHFGGRNLYMEALERNCRHLETLLEQNNPQLLRESLVLPQAQRR